MLLIIMCFRTNKVLFSSGLSTLMLIYLSATNFEKYYKVSVLGSKNNDPSAELQIDPVTGDLYCSNLNRGNIGLHSRKAA
jgi:hypothetical protein